MLRGNPFDASAPAVGYLFQCRWALLLLLRRTYPKPDADLWVEGIDDITFEASGLAIELVQTKHHLNRRGSLTDASPDLWKSLRVWSEAVTAGRILLPEVILTLVTTGLAADGSIAALLRPDHRDPAAVETRLMAIATAAGNAALTDAYDAFRALSAAQRRELVAAVVVLDQAPTIGDVYDRIAEAVHFAVDSQHLRSFVERLEGWWFHRVIRQLTGATPGPIRGGELLAFFDDLRQQFVRDNLPIDFRGLHPEPAIDVDQDARTFVEQLRLVGVNRNRIWFAILDYYRAYQQRARWIREDLLHFVELESYEARLIEELDRQRAILDDRPVPRTNDLEQEGFGRQLLTWMETDADLHIRPQCQEPYVMRGSYHMLADERRVGWHPEFLVRLKAVVARAAR